MTRPYSEATTPSGIETENGQPVRRARRKRRDLTFWQELPILVTVALVLAVLIKTFAFQAFVIPSASMESTIMTDDRVLANKLVYRFREPQRGEVVVFRAHGGWEELPKEEPTNPVSKVLGGIGAATGLGATGTDYIKRIIGLPGDTIALTDGRITVNGVALTEPYTQGINDPAKWRGPLVVPAGEVFVMGDNRQNSDDSRVNGTVRIDQIVGRAAFIMWPRAHWAGLSVPADLDALNAKD